MTRRRASHWLLLVVAALAVLGHICALPFHAHAGAVTTHESHSAQHEEQSAGGHDEQSHAGPCEMLRASAAHLGVVIVAVAAVLAPPVAFEPASVLPSSFLVTSAAPPLFLLHASLLI